MELKLDADSRDLAARLNYNTENLQLQSITFDGRVIPEKILLVETNVWPNIVKPRDLATQGTLTLTLQYANASDPDDWKDIEGSYSTALNFEVTLGGRYATLKASESTKNLNTKDLKGWIDEEFTKTEAKIYRSDDIRILRVTGLLTNGSLEDFKVDVNLFITILP